MVHPVTFLNILYFYKIFLTLKLVSTDQIKQIVHLYKTYAYQMYLIWFLGAQVAHFTDSWFK